MDDLVAFLRARLDEDEAVALAVSNGPHSPETWTAKSYKEGARNWRVDGQVSVVVDGAFGPDAAHIARHDPARILAEIEGKRQIIREWEDAKATAEADRTDVSARVAMLAFGIALRAVAAPCTAHPDYKPEWTPSA